MISGKSDLNKIIETFEAAVEVTIQELVLNTAGNTYRNNNLCYEDVRLWEEPVVKTGYSGGSRNYMGWWLNLNKSAGTCFPENLKISTSPDTVVDLCVVNSILFMRKLSHKDE